MRCPDAGVFSSFVSGALDEGARATLELHVDECDSCRILLSETCRGVAPGRVAARALPAVGDAVDRYTIVGELGAGAMGVVFLARDPELDRELAIKLVQPQPGSAEDELVHQRMLREGRALARIDHPNVVRVFDVGRWEGTLFVAMERAPGRSLREWLAIERRSVAQIAGVIAQCARGLAAAHDAGVVHRDVKPENIIVDDAGRARVTDFGLAMTDDGADLRSLPTGPMNAVTPLASGEVQLTRTHGIVGTPAYMAPEQLRGGAVDGRSDQFALCVVLAEAVNGERPFAAESLEARVALIEAGQIAIAASVPRWLRQVIERGLAADPSARFPSLYALAQALVPPRARWPWFVAAAVTTAIAATAFTLRGGDDPCLDATASFDRAWRADRVGLISTVFASSGKSFAAPAWQYTRDTIDRYAATWRAVRIDACRARPARPSTVRCLERRAGELDALLARWEHAGVETLAAAPFAAEGLGNPESCRYADVDPPPATAAERAHVEALEKQLYAARADDLAGNAMAAVTALTALVPELERAGLRVLHAEALFMLAQNERELGRAKQTREHLVAAIAAAETAGSARTKARAWTALAELSDDVDMRPEESRDALRLAEASIEQAGKPEELELERQVAIALVSMNAGEHEQAIRAVRASLADTSELHVSERTRRLQILARALIAAGQMDAALAELERAEQLITRALGPDSPYLAAVLETQCEPLDYLGRRDEAIARDLRALRIFDASFGTDNPRRALILNNLAVLYGNQGDHARALQLAREVLALQIKAHGAGSHDAAIAHHNLASTLNDLGKPGEALEHLDRALAILTKTVGPEHPLVANVHGTLSSAHALLHHPADALAHARAALAIREKAQVGTGFLAFSRYEVAEALIAAGRRAEGIAMAKRALELPLASTGREGELAKALRELIARH